MPGTLPMPDGQGTPDILMSHSSELPPEIRGIECGRLLKMTALVRCQAALRAVAERSTISPVAAFSRTALMPAMTSSRCLNVGDSATTVPSAAVRRNRYVSSFSIRISNLPAIDAPPYASLHTYVDQRCIHIVKVARTEGEQKLLGGTGHWASYDWIVHEVVGTVPLLRLVVGFDDGDTHREFDRDTSEHELLGRGGCLFDGLNTGFHRVVRGVNHHFVVQEEDQLPGR